MLFQRILGALEFRPGVYREVEHDAAFTATAWMLFVLSALLNQLGSHASRHVGNWLISTVAGVVMSVAGFALAIAIIQWIGRTLFGASVTFHELVRTLGLASIWRAVGVLAVLAMISTALSCLTAPVRLAAAVLNVVAWFVAAKEALDLDWGRTIASVLLGWVVMIGILIVTGVVLGALGLSAGALGGLAGF